MSNKKLISLKKLKKSYYKLFMTELIGLEVSYDVPTTVTNRLVDILFKVVELEYKILVVK